MKIKIHRIYNFCVESILLETPVTMKNGGDTRLDRHEGIMKRENRNIEYAGQVSVLAAYLQYYLQLFPVEVELANINAIAFNPREKKFLFRGFSSAFATIRTSSKVDLLMSPSNFTS